MENYACQFCSCKYDNNDSLWSHIVKFHPDQKPFGIDIGWQRTNLDEGCSSHFIDQNYILTDGRIHMDQNVMIKQEIEAQPVNNTRDILEQCMLEVVKNEPLPTENQLMPAYLTSDGCFQCGSCGVKLLSIPALNDHMASHHFPGSSFDMSSLEMTNQLSFEVGVDSLISSNQSFESCIESQNSVSDQQFNDETSYGGSELEQTELGHSSLDDSLTGDTEQHPIGSYVCKFCLESFMDEAIFNVHVTTHVGEKPYVCRECNCTFYNSNQLKVHVRIHKGELFSCESCPRKCTTKSQLIIHNRIHTGEKPFSCEVCAEKFSCKRYLNIHVKKHDEDKLFSCDECQKKFITQNLLIAHQRFHSGDKPFICEACPKKFVTSNHLRIHERVHSGDKPFSCEDCDKSFTTGTALKKHKLSHTEEKPFSCESCPKTCTTKHLLTIHQRNHSGDKPFECEHCPNKYTTRNALYKHSKIHDESVQASKYKKKDMVKYQLHICPTCFKNFVTEEHLARHQAVMHVTDLAQPQTSAQ